MNKSTKKEDLISLKESLQMQDGAGFVYEKDDNFFLISSVYSNLNDAEKVKNNLKSNNLDCEILKIALSQEKIEGNFSTEEKAILNNCMKADYDAYVALYDIAISLDTKVFDKTKAKLECNNVFAKHISSKTNFQTFFAKSLEKSAFKELSEKMSQTESHLSSLISENFDTKNQTFSSLIKLCYCKILFK